MGTTKGEVMIVSKRISSWLVVSGFGLFASSPLAHNRDGATVFQTVCSNCHKEGSNTQAPLPDVLRRMPVQAIQTALESGKMAAIGAGLSASEKAAVAGYLGV